MENRQWKYVIVSEMMDIRGTDDDKVAVAAMDGGDTVIEVPTCKILVDVDNGELHAKGIEEQTWYTLS